MNPVNIFSMELTEKERLMLVEKKDEIRKLAENILELTIGLKKNEIEIKKKMTGILSLISVIASYTSPKNLDMDALIALTEMVFDQLGSTNRFPRTTKTLLEIFCNIVNSITFGFTKKDLKINIQKIDLSILRTGK